MYVRAFESAYMLHDIISCDMLFYLRAWDLCVETFSGFLDKGCQSIVFRGTGLHRLLNVYVYSIHELTLCQLDLCLDPSCPIYWIHNIWEWHISCKEFTFIISSITHNRTTEWKNVKLINDQVTITIAHTLG